MTERPAPDDSLPDRLFWSRHANPWSVRTLVLAYPTLVLAIYRRDRRLLAGTLAFVVANPLVFRPPESDDAWATRVVLGERTWVERGLRPSVDLLFVACSAPVYVLTLRAAVRRRPVRTAIGTVLSIVLMLVFFERMTRLYDRTKGAGTMA